MCKIELFERELKLYGKAGKTIKVYSRQFSLFLEYFKGEDLRYLSESSIKDYILLLHEIYDYSSIVHAISSIEFFYLKLNKRKRKLNLPRPKKGKYIPTVLSIDEVYKMIVSLSNLKQKCIIEIMFTHGLRRQEVINLTVFDIDSSNMELIIKNSKGAKDRNIPLNEDCLINLRRYWKQYKPKKYLFEGQSGGKYSASSIVNVVKNAAQLANIKKNVTPHTLRHSFASYLVSIDKNLKKISKWMGHSSTKTTEIYTHIIHEANPIFYNKKAS